MPAVILTVTVVLDGVTNATRQEKRMNNRNTEKKDRRCYEDAIANCHKTQEDYPSVQWASQLLNTWKSISCIYTNSKQLGNILGKDTIHPGCKQLKMPKCQLKKCTGTYMKKPCEHLLGILKFQMSSPNVIKIPIPSTFIHKLNAISIRITEEFSSKLTKSL